MLTTSDEGWKVKLSRLDALFHLSHLGSEFRVLCLLTSVPNRVWVVMGFPLSYLPSSKLFLLWPELIYHLNRVCVLLVSSQWFSK